MRRTVMLASRFTVALACLFVLSNFVLLRTSTAADFKLGDFKGTYVSDLPGGTFLGAIYLAADGAGGLTGHWKVVSTITGDILQSEFDGSYTVSPGGLVTALGFDGVVVYTQLEVFLANNDREILGSVALSGGAVSGYATIHGVKQ